MTQRRVKINPIAESGSELAVNLTL